MQDDQRDDAISCRLLLQLARLKTAAFTRRYFGFVIRICLQDLAESCESSAAPAGPPFIFSM